MHSVDVAKLKAVAEEHSSTVNLPPVKENISSRITFACTVANQATLLPTVV